MSTVLAATELDVQTLEKVVIGGDLSGLTAGERLSYYSKVCESVGLNPLTKPFEYITLNERLVLYALRSCTDQLRKIHHISVQIVSRELADGVYVVTAKATMPDGREDESIGAVSLEKEIGNWETSQGGKKYFKGNGQFKALNPDDRANAIMKAETKAKRRVTLSICGLSMLDETEISSIPNGKRNGAIMVDHATGEIIESKNASVNKPDEEDGGEASICAVPIPPTTSGAHGAQHPARVYEVDEKAAGEVLKTVGMSKAQFIVWKEECSSRELNWAAMVFEGSENGCATAQEYLEFITGYGQHQGSDLRQVAEVI